MTCRGELAKPQGGVDPRWFCDDEGKKNTQAGLHVGKARKCRQNGYMSINSLRAEFGNQQNFLYLVIGGGGGS